MCSYYPCWNEDLCKTTAGAFRLKVSPKTTQANCLAKTKINKTAWSKVNVSLQVLCFPKSTWGSEAFIKWAWHKPGITGWAWSPDTHPDGFLSTPKVLISKLGILQTWKFGCDFQKNTKLCKSCVNVGILKWSCPLLFSWFFFMFFSASWSWKNCQGEVGEIRRRWQDWRSLYWGCSEGQEGPVLESHLVGDYIPSVGRLYPCYSHLTGTKSSWGRKWFRIWKSHQNDLQMFFWGNCRLMV